MNVENLKRMVQYLRENVKDSQFDMNTYRLYPNDRKNLECNSIACVIGHCTILDKNNICEKFLNLEGEIQFFEWSREFTQLYKYGMWDWCFSPRWSDHDNTIEGACRRIEFLIENPDENYNNWAYLYHKMGLEFNREKYYMIN